MKSRYFTLIILLLHEVFSYPESGKWDFTTSGVSEQSIVVTKSSYNKGKILVSLKCELNGANEYDLEVNWYIRKIPCWKEFYATEPVSTSAYNVFTGVETLKLANESSEYLRGVQIHPCDGKSFNLVRKENQELLSTKDIKAASENDNSASGQWTSFKKMTKNQDLNKTEALAQFKREVNYPSGTSKSGMGNAPALYIVPADGIYQLILSTRIASATIGQNVSYEAFIRVDMYSSYGYLSAADYPLLVFYSTMCVIYLLFALGWLTVSFMRWRELLRVQYWIGAVILLGMLEKAAFTAEYENINKNGVSLRGLVIFAELISCLKRTLSRMLIIIVAFGFGIVKPRLGIVLHRVVGVGLLYFVLSSIEGCMRVAGTSTPTDQRRQLLSIIPLALLESAICWWVFSALIQTIRTLRLRRNMVKLALYKHLLNTLAFTVLISVIFMLWSIKYQKLDDCLSDWKEIWVDQAFWHILFALILIVIMVLWRPTNNNQRFAFTPLLDDLSEGTDEETEKLMANVSDNMKLRNSRTSTADIPRKEQGLEEDMKWLDENIPSGIVDTALPAMDSDEEILTTRFEMSKMQ